MELLPAYNNRMLPRAILCALLVSISASLIAHAQTLDSKGKEFWVAFMANLGSGDPNSAETSDLRVYVSCDRPTSVSVTYTVTGETRVIPIPAANVSVEVNVNGLFGEFVELDDVFGANEITPKSLHITCPDEISLYGANIRTKSADAFLGLPVDVLSGTYIVLAYPNGFNKPFGSAVGHYDVPSEFCVVATEDGTVLRVIPSPGLTINGRSSDPFAVNLNRGDVFFGQADVTEFREQDVSGTQLSANKPVAVFSGNKRTSIPTRVGNFRDHLVEQLPPLDAWGKGALLTPHFKISPQSRDTAVARILAAFPGTDVTITGPNGAQQFSLSTAASMEIPLLDPMSVVATQPILVAQYEHSVNINDNGGGGFGLGDPFMMLIPPSEQFDTAYAFQSIIHPEFANQHYINVVVPGNASNTLRLDGNPVSAAFQPIPGSRYVYAQVKVSAGSHYIVADSAFGLYVYGFGNANSYGYPGGMLFRKLVSDFEAPEIAWQAGCDEVHGFAYDSRITDTGIDSLIPTHDTANVRLMVDPFKPGADTVGYRAQLIDPYQDGVVGVMAIDSGGRSRTFVRGIPGFTVRVANTTDAPATLDTFTVLNSKKFCRSVQIRNYGKYEQRLTRANLTDTLSTGFVTIDPAQFPMTIPPGGFSTIEICFENLADTVVTVGLDVAGDCGTRRIAMMPIDNRVDTTAPSFGMEGDPCGDEFTLTYFERARSAGIAAVDFDSTENCTVEKLIDPAQLPAQLVKVKLHRTDPRKEVVYTVTLRDAAGNSVVQRDTIGGFTVNVLNQQGDTIGTRYDRSYDGDSLTLYDRACDSIQITNYGTRPLVIERVIMRGNQLYSIPPSQFPVVIAPRASRRLSVCMVGRADYGQEDTLVVVDGCGHEEMVAMKNPVRPLSAEGVDKCGNTISIDTYAPTKRVFLTTPVPNPSAGEALVDIGLPVGERVSVEVFRSSGEPALSVVKGVDLPAGISRVRFGVEELENGSYYCRLTTASGKVIVEKMIVKR